MVSTIHGTIDKGIFKFDRRIFSWRGHATSSNSSFRASSRSAGKHNWFTQLRKSRIAKYADARKLLGRHAKVNPDDGADRIKIVERFGDMITADQKVLNEEQESRLHHRFVVVVQDLATQWIQSYPCKTKSVEETQRSLRKFFRPEETQDPFMLAILWNLSKLAKSWSGIIRDVGHTDPTQLELQNELYDEWKKALRQYWFSLDFENAGGQWRWSVIAISDMCKPYLRMARRLSNVGSIHNLKGVLFHVVQ